MKAVVPASATGIGGDQSLCYSLGRRAGDFVFTSGQILTDGRKVEIEMVDYKPV